MPASLPCDRPAVDFIVRAFLPPSLTLLPVPLPRSLSDPTLGYGTGTGPGEVVGHGSPVARLIALARDLSEGELQSAPAASSSAPFLENPCDCSRSVVISLTVSNSTLEMALTFQGKLPG